MFVEAQLRMMAAGFRVNAGAGMSCGYATSPVPAPVAGSDSRIQWALVPPHENGPQAVAEQVLQLPALERLAALESLDTHLHWRMPYTMLCPLEAAQEAAAAAE